MLAEHGIGAAPVVEDGRIVGLLRDEDLILSEAKLHVPTVIEFLGADIVWPRLRAPVGEGAQEGGRRDRPRRDDHRVPPRRAHRHRRAASRPLMHDEGASHVPVVDGRPGRRDRRARRPRPAPRGHDVKLASHADDRAPRWEPRGVERGRSRRGARQRARAARARRARRGARGGEGRRVRPRRGAGRARRARRGRDVARASRWVEEGVAAARGRHRRADPAALGAAAARPPRRSSRTGITPVVYTRAGDRRARPRRSPTSGGRDRSRCTSRSTPACTASAATRPGGRAGRAHRRAAPSSTLGGRLHAPRGRRRARATRTPTDQLDRFDAVLDALARRGIDPGSCTRRTRPGARVPRRALRPRARRHRRVRRPAVAVARRRSSRCSPRSRCTRGSTMVKELAAGERVSYGLRYELAARRAASRPCPRGTPTVCPATSGWSVARCSSAAGAARSPASSRWTS